MSNNTLNFSDQVSYNLNPVKDIQTYIGITTLPNNIDYNYTVNLNLNYGATYAFKNMNDPTNSISITWILYLSDGINPICQTVFNPLTIPNPIVPINLYQSFPNTLFNVEQNNTIIYGVIISGNCIISNVFINTSFDYIFNNIYLQSAIYSYTASYANSPILSLGTTNLGKSLVPNTYSYYLNTSYSIDIILTYAFFYYELDGTNIITFQLIDSNGNVLGSYDYAATYSGQGYKSVAGSITFGPLNIIPGTYIRINVIPYNIQVQSIFTNIKYVYFPYPIIYGFDKIGNYYYLNDEVYNQNVWQLAGQADCISIGSDCTIVVCFNNTVTLINQNNESTLIPSPATDAYPNFISISCADINNIYGILVNSQVLYQYNYIIKKWIVINGIQLNLTDVSVGFDGSVFVVDETTKVIQYVGGSWTKILINGNLFQANQIAVFNASTIWGVYNNLIFLYINNTLITTPLPIIGNIEIMSIDISVSYDGSVWCTVNGILFERKGISAYELIGTSWNLISVTGLTIDEMDLFQYLQITTSLPIVNSVNPLYQVNYIPISTMVDQFDFPLISYIPSPAITSSTNMIWGTSSSQITYYYNNHLGIWSEGGSSQFISVGCDNRAVFYSNNVLHIGAIHVDATSSYFTDIKWYDYYPGVSNVNFVYLTMADIHYITAVGDDNNIYRYSSSDRWYTLGRAPAGCIFSTVSVGYEASTFATDINGNVYLFDDISSNWNIQKSIDPSNLQTSNIQFIQLAVGSKDYYWGINNVNGNNVIQLINKNYIITVNPPFNNSNKYLPSGINDNIPDDVELPRDDAVLDEIVQWWYWTGHLQSKNGSLTFGFEITFFIVAGFGNLLQCAITDVTNNKFYFNEYLSTNPPDVIPNAFNLVAENGIGLARGGNGIDHLECIAGPYKLIIDAVQTKRTTIHYNGTRHQFSFGGNTKYYSRTQMQTVGTITNTTTNQVYDVNGNTWFDRQYGGLLIAISKGWQWFAIGLNDNTDIMLFDFKGNFPNENFGSFTDATGNNRFDFNSNSFSVIDVGSGWVSPNTKIVYPNIWQVQFAIDNQGTLGPIYIIMPQVADQELRVKYSPIYWEGTCDVYPATGSNIQDSIAAIESGKVAAVGKSYTELNGYGSNPNPKIPWFPISTSTVLTDQISVCVDGTVYGLFNGVMYRRDGITKTIPQGNAWTLMTNPINDNLINTSSQITSFSVGPGPDNTITGVNPDYEFPLLDPVKEPNLPTDTCVWCIGYDNNPYFLYSDAPFLINNYNLQNVPLTQYTYDAFGGSVYNVKNRTSGGFSPILLVDVMIVPQNLQISTTCNINITFSCGSNVSGTSITYGLYSNLNPGALVPIVFSSFTTTTTDPSIIVSQPVQTFPNVVLLQGSPLFYGITIGTGGGDLNTTLSNITMNVNFDYNYTKLDLNYFDFNCTSPTGPLTSPTQVSIGVPTYLPPDFDYTIPVPQNSVNFIVTNLSDGQGSPSATGTISLINVSNGTVLYSFPITFNNNSIQTFQNSLSQIQFTKDQINIQVSISAGTVYNITVDLNFGYIPTIIPPLNCVSIGINNTILYCDNRNSSLTQLYIRQGWTPSSPVGTNWSKFSTLSRSTISPTLPPGIMTIKFYQISIGDTTMSNLWAIDFDGKLYRYNSSLTPGIWTNQTTPATTTLQNISLGLDGTLYAISGEPPTYNILFVPVPNNFYFDGTINGGDTGVKILGTFTVPADYIPGSYSTIIASYQGIYGPNNPDLLQEYSWYVRDANNNNIIRWGLIVPPGGGPQQPANYSITGDSIFTNVVLGVPGSTITVYAESHYPASTLTNPGIIIRSITYSPRTIPPNNVYNTPLTPMNNPPTWTELTTLKLTYISVGTPNYYWGIDANNNMYAFVNGISRYIPYPQEISTVSDVSVSVSYDGNVWCIVSGLIFRREGITSINKYGEIWTQEPNFTIFANPVYNISACYGSSNWSLTFPQITPYPFFDNDIVIWAILNNGIYLYSNFVWQTVPLGINTGQTLTGIKQISVGFDGSVFVLTATGNLYFRSSITLTNLMGVTWIPYVISGTNPAITSQIITYVYIYDTTTIYLVYSDGSVYFLQNGFSNIFQQLSITDNNGVNLNIINVSISSNGIFYLIDNTGIPYQLTPNLTAVTAPLNTIFKKSVCNPVMNSISWSLDNTGRIIYNFIIYINNPPGSDTIYDITTSDDGTCCVIDNHGIIYRFFGNPQGVYSWNLIFTPINDPTFSGTYTNINVLSPIYVPPGSTPNQFMNIINSPYYNIYSYNGTINGGGSNNVKSFGTFTVPDDYDGISYATVIVSFQGIYEPVNPGSVQEYDFHFKNNITNINVFGWEFLVYPGETVYQPTFLSTEKTFNVILGPPGSIMTATCLVSYYGATMINPQMYIKSITYKNQIIRNPYPYVSDSWVEFYNYIDPLTQWQQTPYGLQQYTYNPLLQPSSILNAGYYQGTENYNPPVAPTTNLSLESNYFSTYKNTSFCFGYAHSGGGTRASSSNLGICSSLYNAGYYNFNFFAYTCTNSGGGYTDFKINYRRYNPGRQYDVPIQYMLGPYYQSIDLTYENLQTGDLSQDTRIARCLVNDKTYNINNFVSDNFLTSVNYYIWERDEHLQPFDLTQGSRNDNFWTFTSLNQTSLENLVRTRIYSYDRIPLSYEYLNTVTPWYISKCDKDYNGKYNLSIPIAVWGIFKSQTATRTTWQWITRQSVTLKEVLYPSEFTPGACGTYRTPNSINFIGGTPSPTIYNSFYSYKTDVPITGSQYSYIVNGDQRPITGVNGILDTAALQAVRKNWQLLYQGKNPPNCQPLDGMYISSAAAAVFAGFLRCNYPQIVGNYATGVQSDPDYSNTNYADGGKIDNYAIMPLLQRRINNIIVVCSVSRQFYQVVIKNSPSEFDFFYYFNVSHDDYANPYASSVFPRTDLDILWSTLWNNYANYGVALTTISHTFNPHWQCAYIYGFDDPYYGSYDNRGSNGIPALPPSQNVYIPTLTWLLQSRPVRSPTNQVDLPPPAPFVSGQALFTLKDSAFWKSMVRNQGYTTNSVWSFFQAIVRSSNSALKFFNLYEDSAYNFPYYNTFTRLQINYDLINALKFYHSALSDYYLVPFINKNMSPLHLFFTPTGIIPIQALLEQSYSVYDGAILQYYLPTIPVVIPTIFNSLEVNVCYCPQIQGYIMCQNYFIRTYYNPCTSANNFKSNALDYWYASTNIFVLQCGGTNIVFTQQPTITVNNNGNVIVCGASSNFTDTTLFYFPYTSIAPPAGNGIQSVKSGQITYINTSIQCTKFVISPAVPCNFILNSCLLLTSCHPNKDTSPAFNKYYVGTGQANVPGATSNLWISTNNLSTFTPVIYAQFTQNNTYIYKILDTCKYYQDTGRGQYHQTVVCVNTPNPTQMPLKYSSVLTFCTEPFDSPPIPSIFYTGLNPQTSNQPNTVYPYGVYDIVYCPTLDGLFVAYASNNTGILGIDFYDCTYPPHSGLALGTPDKLACSILNFVPLQTPSQPSPLVITPVNHFVLQYVGKQLLLSSDTTLYALVDTTFPLAASKTGAGGTAQLYFSSMNNTNFPGINIVSIY
jgi:predicted secreted hydrolase